MSVVPPREREVFGPARFDRKSDPLLPLYEQVKLLRERAGIPSIDIDFYTDKYFARTVQVLNHAGRSPKTVKQFFAKKHGMLCGMAECIMILHEYAPSYLVVHAVPDGTEVEPWKPVLTIEGDSRDHSPLETILLGILARRSLVATNARSTVQAANNKPVIFMGARHDDWRVQEGDGYAAVQGGVQRVATDAQGLWSGLRGVGTIPHELIADFGGDTAAATVAFAEWARTSGPDIPVISLVDYDNNVIETSLKVCAAMRERSLPLYGVRVDTSENLVDRGVNYSGMEKPTGVTIPMVDQLRYALDMAGYPHVKIVVSGGFNPKKIAEFESKTRNVDMYGVGSSIIGHGGSDVGLLNSFDFTADVVMLDGFPQSKVGRRHVPSRIHRVDWRML